MPDPDVAHSLADNSLVASPLATLERGGQQKNRGEAGVWLAERRALGKLVLRGDAADAAFAGTAARLLRSTLPPACRAQPAGDLTILWQGPDHWLVTGPRQRIDGLGGELSAALQGTHAMVTEYSAALTCLRLGGRHARDLLYKGCFLDLDNPHFVTGYCATTRIAAFAITLQQIDDTPTYDLYVARSVALSFANWLLDAGREFAIGWNNEPATA